MHRIIRAVAYCHIIRVLTHTEYRIGIGIDDGVLVVATVEEAEGVGYLTVREVILRLLVARRHRRPDMSRGVGVLEQRYIRELHLLIISSELDGNRSVGSRLDGSLELLPPVLVRIVVEQVLHTTVIGDNTLGFVTGERQLVGGRCSTLKGHCTLCAALSTDNHLHGVSRVGAKTIDRLADGRTGRDDVDGG